MIFSIKWINEDMESLLTYFSMIILYCSNPVNYCDVKKVSSPIQDKYEIEVCIPNERIADMNIGIIDLDTKQSEIIKYKFIGCIDG